VKSKWVKNKKLTPKQQNKALHILTRVSQDLAYSTKALTGEISKQRIELADLQRRIETLELRGTRFM
jgi:BMFP domain-containing protein YqiC